MGGRLFRRRRRRRPPVRPSGWTDDREPSAGLRLRSGIWPAGRSLLSLHDRRRRRSAALFRTARRSKRKRRRNVSRLEFLSYLRTTFSLCSKCMPQTLRSWLRCVNEDSIDFDDFVTRSVRVRVLLPLVILLRFVKDCRCCPSVTVRKKIALSALWLRLRCVNRRSSRVDSM